LFGGDYIAAIDMMALEDWTISDNVFGTSEDATAAGGRGLRLGPFPGVGWNEI